MGTINIFKAVAFSTLFFLILFRGVDYQVSAQNVGINSTGGSAHSSALLDVDASPGNNRGFLMPRLTTAERDAIGSPIEGLQIYNLDCHTINYYNGAVWIPFGNVGSVTTPGAITGNSSPSPSATGETYSIVSVNGATAYNWTVPSGATITAGQGTTSITVDFGTTEGNICVTANNACGTSSSSCLAITFYNTCFDGVTAVVNVTGGGSRVWMDRNLGATQVATSSTDASAFGDLYQWGRCPDGHEDRSSGTISTNATTAVPNLGNAWDGLFIPEVDSPFDWLTPQDNSLWQGTSGTNNPCPGGYRLPTDVEWDTERLSWATNNTAGAYGSSLKFTAAQFRNYSDGSLSPVVQGIYWCSTVSGFFSRIGTFDATNAGLNIYNRSHGVSVRCIQD